MTLEQNFSSSDSPQLIELSVDEIACVLVDSLVLDELTSYELKNSVDPYNKLLSMNQGVIAHRVMDILLSQESRNDDPYHSYYHALEHPYELMAAVTVFSKIESVRKPFKEKLYHLLKTTPDTTRDKDISGHHRIEFLIAARDWENLLAEMEAGTIPYECVFGMLTTYFDFETLYEDESFRSFFEDRFVRFLVVHEDWRILVEMGYFGSRGGVQHPVVPVDVVDRAYRDLLSKVDQGKYSASVVVNFLREFPDLLKKNTHSL